MTTRTRPASPTAPRRHVHAIIAAAAACGLLFGRAEAAGAGTVCAAFVSGCEAAGAALSEDELAALRGGYRGVLFGISFFGDATSLFGQTGVEAPEGVSVDFTSDNVVQISAGLGTLPDGFNGVFQNTTIFGDFNTVNNNLVINAVFLNDATDASAFFTY